MDIIIIVVFGIFGLSLIVLVHELGHYFAARICKVRVEKFSIGFGKKLAGFTHKGITYQISWFLLGGYCKLKGEMSKPDFTEEDFQKAKNEEGSFLSASPLRKIIIVAAGPLANIIFAALIFSIIALIGYTIETSSTKIILQTEYPTDIQPVTAARDAGLETGDTVVAINGKEINYFDDMLKAVSENQGKSLLFTVKRGDDIFDISITPEQAPGEYVPRIGVYAWTDPVISMVEKGKPADKAGLMEGDIILSANQVDVEHTVAFYHVFNTKPGEVSLSFERNGERKNTLLHLDYKDNVMQDPGIYFKRLLIPSPRYNPFTALIRGIERTGEILGLIIKSFAILFRVGVKNVSDVVAGPIRITQMVGQQALTGFNVGFGEGMSNFFNFICLISVLLGFMNLLPIPVLDGGHIILALIMGVRKKMGPRFVMRYQLVGFSIIVMLTILAVFSDISYFFKF
ncbi:MAG: RIP metalloprotease RseP [Spirochaetales bacterium]|nr:RIP metalloprotease RseP [Spirochaetales bacterium]